MEPIGKRIYVEPNLTSIWQHDIAPQKMALSLRRPPRKWMMETC